MSLELELEVITEYPHGTDGGLKSLKELGFPSLGWLEPGPRPPALRIRDDDDTLEQNIMVVMGMESGIGRRPFSRKVSPVPSTSFVFYLPDFSPCAWSADFQKPWLAAPATKYQISF